MEELMGPDAILFKAGDVFKPRNKNCAVGQLALSRCRLQFRTHKVANDLLKD